MDSVTAGTPEEESSANDDQEIEAATPEKSSKGRKKVAANE
jgi:hypothetical protein